MTTDATRRLQLARFLALAFILASVILLVRLSPVSAYLEKEALIHFLEQIKTQWWGPIVFIALYAIACIAAIPGVLFTLAGGAVFGAALGTLYNLLGANLGASLAFAISRLLGRDFIGSLLKQTKWDIFDEKAAQNGFQVILTLRLIPLAPFNAINFGAGFSKIRYKDYLIGSLLGMLPGAFVYTYFADALLKGVQGAGRKAYFHMGVASVCLIALSFAPRIYQKLKKT